MRLNKVKQLLLTINFVIVSKDHLHMIPLEEAAFPIEGLSKHHVLVTPEGERLHRYGLEVEGLVGGKL